jgi:hypothetical protein
MNGLKETIFRLEKHNNNLIWRTTHNIVSSVREKKNIDVRRIQIMNELKETICRIYEIAIS